MSSLLFGNGTDIVHWQPSCNTRGTFDILSTCIITMLLCVWTAVHLNVPPPGSDWESRLRKVGWLILTLLAPELVAFTALYQRQQALLIVHEVNKTFGLPGPPSWYDTAAKSIAKAATRLKRTIMLPSQGPMRQPTLEAQKETLRQDRHPWTIVHGFYAIMGGLAIQIPDNLPESKRFLPSDNSEIWFLTSDGVHHLLEQESTHDDLPDLSTEEIRSKSKANGLAKALVCIQAMWFIAQCITRLAQHISISLLELNTFGHALCAVLIYVLWWEKPFEVDYPTLIQSQNLWDWSALYAMQSHRSAATELMNQKVRARVKGEKRFQALKKIKLDSNRIGTRTSLSLLEYPSAELDLISSKVLDDESCIGNGIGASNQESDLLGNEEVTSIILEPGQILQGTGFQILRPQDIPYSELVTVSNSGIVNLTSTRPEVRKAFNELHSTLPHVNLTARDITRWRMAWRACRPHLQKKPNNIRTLPDASHHQLLARRCRDWPEWYRIINVPTFLGFTAATFIYGGLHALAWSAHFESATEKLLWRISSCVVMGGLPMILSIAGLQHHTRIAFWQYHSALKRRLNGIFDSTLWYICIVMIVANVLARAYLVVECFINVFHLPAGVFDTPEWSTYFPHIS